MPQKDVAKAIARGWYHPMSLWESIRIRPRVWFAAGAGTAAFVFCPGEWPGTVRASISWDIFGLVYLIFAFWLIYKSGAAQIKSRAAQHDDSRLVILSLILLSICASFVAIAQLVGHVKHLEGTEKTVLTGLAILTIVLSWTVTQTAFALHYAHEYYAPGPNSDAKHGLIFPQCEVPDYWDFLYFSMSIGAASQTSDTSISSHNLRRLVTLHSVIAFFFNTAVLALAVNIAASLPDAH
ncbi:MULTISPECIES: DUF1345 domain-containing protein [Rhodomicrobium]|uniref:DUF1345 domain-containing protein n=1 Tax=Rhodomicrobium TaxID=1068 RepID=UPI001FDA287C|nr:MULTISPECIES: DUF1345 domain-containing protein [Rhodomicrobium]